MTNYTGTGISGPDGITTGPDRALWFTNWGNYYPMVVSCIGRMTTGGTVTSTWCDDREPYGITVGSDGALWFTDDWDNMIGRMPTAVTPQITDMSPDSGAAGTQVTITGSKLAGATAVAFNGTPASIISDTATSIVTWVPDGATTGLITVTTSAGTATTVHNFVVTP